MKAAPASHGAQAGVALAIVVWFIAGMALLVAGIVQQGRYDTRMAQVHVAQAKAAAAGDGAIQLMMAALTSGELTRDGESLPAVRGFRVGAQQVSVQLVPAAGLVNLSAAPRDMLVALFDATVGDGETLADNVIQWRAPPGRGARRFEAVEELLRIEGFDRLRLEAVRDYVYAGKADGGGLNAAMAPEGVLGATGTSAPADFDQLGRQRGGKKARRRRERQAAELEAVGTGSGRYRVDALIDYGGQRWLRRRWVRIGNSAHTGLPWHFTRTEAPRVLDIQG